MINSNFFDENEFDNDEFKYEQPNSEYGEISIIDELIDSLNIESMELQNEPQKKYDKRKNNKKKVVKNNDVLKVKAEYEIIMDCDDSDYIIYYKK